MIKMIVIKTETVVTTEVFEVETGAGPRGFPTLENSAISDATAENRIGKDIQRDIKFQVMPRVAGLLGGGNYAR